MTIRPTFGCESLAEYESYDPIEGSSFVGLHRNEAAIPPPRHVVEAIRGIVASTLQRYPVQLQREVEQRLARRLGLSDEAVAIANGADELLLAAARLVLSPNDEAVMLRPAFGMYARAARSCGAVVREICYSSRWKIDEAALIDAINPRTKIVYLASPNNPTGDTIAAEFLERLAAARTDVLIVLDEVYASLRGDSSTWLAKTYANVVVVGSLSKTAALAGIRIGYAVASPGLAQSFRTLLAPFPISAPSLVAAQAYLANERETARFERDLDRVTRRSLAAISAAIEPFATSVWNGPTNFILADLGAAAAPSVEYLRSQRILVRTFDDPFLAGCVRISGANDDDTQRLVAALRAMPATLTSQAARA